MENSPPDVTAELEALSPDAQFERSIRLLEQGRYAEAWPLWEARPSRRDLKLWKLPFPEWRGEDLTGKSILIWGEQGHGDEVQGARYIRQLRERGAARIRVACLSANIRLFEAAGADEAFNRIGGYSPNEDYWAVLWSLPRALGVTRENTSGQPYLPSPPTTRTGGVGVVLSGSPTHIFDRHRSLPDDTLLRRLPGAVELRPRGDTIDSLAQLAALDLLVTVDTSWAHLAGAIGLPCWVLISRCGTDWRWFPAGSERTPWYDSLRLFWQETPGDWRSVIDAVADGLAAHPNLAGRPSA